MAKKKPVSKFSRLLSYCGGKEDYFPPQIYILREAGLIAATDGKRLLCQRDIFPEVSVTARLLDIGHAAEIGDDETLRAPDGPSREPKSLNDLIKGLSNLKQRQAMRVEIPAWIATLSKRPPKKAADHPVIGFEFSETPRLVIGATGNEKTVCLDANYLRDLAGALVDVYFTYPLDPVVMLPAGSDFDSVPWFAVIMPRRDTRIACELLTKRAAA